MNFVITYRTTPMDCTRRGIGVPCPDYEVFEIIEYAMSGLHR